MPQKMLSIFHPTLREEQAGQPHVEPKRFASMKAVGTCALPTLEFGCHSTHGEQKDEETEKTGEPLEAKEDSKRNEESTKEVVQEKHQSDQVSNAKEKDKAEEAEADPGEKISDEKISDEKISNEKISDEKISDEKISEKISDETTSNEKISDEKTSDEKISDEEAGMTAEKATKVKNPEKKTRGRRKKVAKAEEEDDPQEVAKKECSKNPTRPDFLDTLPPVAPAKQPKAAKKKRVKKESLEDMSHLEDKGEGKAGKADKPSKKSTAKSKGCTAKGKAKASKKSSKTTKETPDKKACDGSSEEAPNHRKEREGGGGQEKEGPQRFQSKCKVTKERGRKARQQEEVKREDRGRACEDEEAIQEVIGIPLRFEKGASWRQRWEWSTRGSEEGTKGWDWVCGDGGGPMLSTPEFNVSSCQGSALTPHHTPKKSTHYLLYPALSVRPTQTRSESTRNVVKRTMGHRVFFQGQGNRIWVLWPWIGVTLHSRDLHGILHPLIEIEVWQWKRSIYLHFEACKHGFPKYPNPGNF